MTTPRLLNLAARSLGASVLAANDESFGEKENLLVDSAADFTPGTFGHKGEIVDGWETRRRRAVPGDDWALIRLGAPGVVESVDIDTSFFTGNFPTHAMLEGCGMEGYPTAEELRSSCAEWEVLVPWSELAGDTHNVFATTSATRFTHVRLSIRPDGGVARLRVNGHALPDPRVLDGLTVDLASRELGGMVETSSDDFYSNAEVLNLPGEPRTMGEGWETQRRRDDGHDWAVIRLAAAAVPQLIEIDTSYYVFNASAEVELWGIVSVGDTVPEVQSAEWFPLLPRTALRPDTRHRFRLDAGPEVTHVRLDAFPDGGLARVRVLGSIVGASRQGLATRWFNALPRAQALAVLQSDGLPSDLAASVTAARPVLREGSGSTCGSESQLNRVASCSVRVGQTTGS